MFHDNVFIIKIALLFKRKLFASQLDTCEIMNRTIKMQRMPITFVRFYYTDAIFLHLHYINSNEKFSLAVIPSFRR